MVNGIDSLLPGDDAAWVRLRTLVMLRWLAICGQIITVTIAQIWLGLQLELGLIYLAIGASVIANTVAMFVYPQTKRLAENEAMLTLLFDIAQLAVLLYLTGGLNNPFALLILAPVTVSAATLRIGSTVTLALAAIGLMTLVGLLHLPLRLDQGFILRKPDILIFGNWLAIVIGVVFVGAYAYRVSRETQSMSEALLAAQMALAREQKLTDLGGVVAAAAHELGTPLATIKLVSTELGEELSDRPDLEFLREDTDLIREQADRCRDILRSMGRAGKDDLHMRFGPLAAVVRDAAEPHENRGKTLTITESPDPSGDPKQPAIRRFPEVIHGLRNLVQNAVDFADSSVDVDVGWTDAVIRIRIADDGPGFPQHMFGRIGDPFMRRRRSQPQKDRPGYEGMGLGLFIAKTLLERTGAQLSFANGPGPRGGAVVEVLWARAELEQPEAERTGPLGENLPIAR